MNENYPTAGNLDAIDTADGSRIVAKRTGANKGVTLGLGVFVFVIDIESGCEHVHLKWSAALEATFTFETSSLTETDVDGQDDVTDHSLAAGDWVQENPTIPAGSIPVVGTDNSATNMTIMAGGTNAGAASIHIGNIGARRVRVKADVATGGLLRVATNGRGSK